MRGGTYPGGTSLAAMMDLDLDGNTALVTASSSGLGKASAISLAREGANVVINGRNEERLADAASDIRSAAPNGGAVLAHSGDITRRDDIEGLVERTVTEFGRLDHLVTSAGGPPPYRPLEPTDDEWYTAFDLLVMSVVRVIREAAHYLTADGGGTVVTITSRTVKEARETNVLSSAVRMGVIGLGKTLSRELAPAVRVNSVLPGPYETPRLREVIQDRADEGDYESYDAAKAAYGTAIPLGRIGRPMEFGDVVAFLSSDRSGFITGVAIPADGGDSRSNL